MPRNDSPEAAERRRQRDRDRAPEKNRAYYAANKEREAARKLAYRKTPQYAATLAAWREKNYERIREKQRAYAKAHPEKLSAAGKKHRASGNRKAWLAEYNRKNAEIIAKKAADRAKARPELKRAAKGRRRSAALMATPSWADHNAIFEIYAEAERLTREVLTKHEVDHIIPLQGENVCGLHWENNLQVLTQEQNRRKNNKLGTDIGLS